MKIMESTSHDIPSISFLRLYMFYFLCFIFFVLLVAIQALIYVSIVDISNI